MKSDSYRHYLLGILTFILTFNFVDRFALGLVLEDIKVDLRLSDTELGLLNGIAFALFYSLLGIPIARSADRGNRVTIIATTAALWSVMVAMCGAATTFIQLLLIRVGVGVGEAGCVPPAQSLISDYFTRKDLPRVIAIYWQGPNISLIIGYFAAGWVNQFFGWRVLFLILGLPGLVVAALAWLSLKDPRSVPSVANGGRLPMDVFPKLRDVVRMLWSNRTFRHLLYAFSVFYFFMYGIAQWQPTFFVRSFELQSGELGTWLTVIYGLPAIVGMYLGGVWASRYAGRNEKLQLRFMAIANAVFNAVIWALIYLSYSSQVAFAWMALACLGGNVMMGPLYALPQVLVPARMRATAVAIIFLFANLIGMGLGPVAVGFVSDMLRPSFGEEALRHTLLLFTPGYLWISWHLWAASKTVERDIAAQPTESSEEAVWQPTQA